MPIGGAANF